MGAGFLGAGEVLCYTTIGVAEEKVVVGHKLFELDRPSLSSCHVCHYGPDSCWMIRKLIGIY